MSMKRVLFTTLILEILVSARADIYLPVADGSTYNGGGFGPGFVEVSDELGSPIDGDIQFASFNAASYNSIQLELSVLYRPIWQYSIDVYGFDNAAGQLSFADFQTGTYIGTWVLPQNLQFQEVFFDVTAFVKSTTGNYFGFDLRTSGTDGRDIFCSTENNYGIPPELIATVPEPAFPALIGLAVGVIVTSSIYRTVCIRGQLARNR